MTDALYERIYSAPDIYKINVPLPGNPLKNLNSYIIKTPEGNLIIDTGFNMPESREALLTGLDRLETDMSRTEIYATHMHTDHTGLIGEIMRPDTVVYMDPVDYELAVYSMRNQWGELEKKMVREGFPEDEMLTNRSTNPARIFGTGKPFKARPVSDGEKISVGPYTLTVISVPGHTPGNTCLYLERDGILFSGDHILFDITPNITSWPNMENALGSYLENLKKVRELDIRLTLPAHRNNGMDVYRRIDELLAHHEKRLQNTLDVLRDHPGVNACEAASHMQWSMRGKAWAEFPVHQKWFAVGETCAHLDHLLACGRAVRETVDGKNIYYAGRNIAIGSNAQNSVG